MKEKRIRKRPATNKNPTKRADALHTQLGNVLFAINNSTDDVKSCLVQMLYADATDDLRYERWNQAMLDAINFIEAPKQDEYDGRFP
jgi:hypothetical protein